MKKLLILLLFSFPLFAEEKIKLLCEGTMFNEFGDTKKKHSYKKSMVLKIDDKGINVDDRRYERTSIQKDSLYEEYTNYEKDEDKISYYHEITNRSDGTITNFSAGTINRMTAEFRESSYIRRTSLYSDFEGKCKKAERVF